MNEVWTAFGEMGGSRSPCFTRPFSDWKMEEVERLFCCLGGKKVNVDEEDRVRWMDSKDGVFSVKSLYRAAAGVSCFFPFEDYLELLCVAQIKLFCVEGFMGKSYNLGSFAKERLDFGK